jgi:hypothetical protein
MAELRIMEAVVAVERHRVATGELPVALDRVAPEFMSATPIDPFDGQAIRYARKDLDSTQCLKCDADLSPSANPKNTDNPIGINLSGGSATKTHQV